MRLLCGDGAAASMLTCPRMPAIAANSPTPAAPRRVHLFLAAVGVTLLAVYGSFVPMEFKRLSWDQAVASFRDVPYLQLGVYRRADLVANLLLFMPLGFLWLGCVDADRRNRTLAIVALPMIAAMLAALAVAIEFAQQWTTRRTVSQNDIYAEAIGGVAGMVAWLLFGRTLLRRVRDLTAPTGDEHPTRRLLQLYALGFLLYCVQPLDVTFSPAEISRKLNDMVVTRDGQAFEGRIRQHTASAITIEVRSDQGTFTRTIPAADVQHVHPKRVILVPFSHTYRNAFDVAWQLVIDAILFVPIGMWLRLRRGAVVAGGAAGGRGQGRGLHVVLLRAVLLAAAIELMQIFVFSRYVDTTDIIAGAMGALGGALIGGRLGIGEARAGARDGREAATGMRVPLALAATLVYAVPLALTFWHPFNRGTGDAMMRLRGLFDLPFKAHYFGSEFAALTNMLRGIMLFLPIGALWRWAGGREHLAAARLLGIGLTLAIALGIQVGKALLAGKPADNTDVMMDLFGAWAGWWLWGVVTGTKMKPTEANSAG